MTFSKLGTKIGTNASTDNDLSSAPLISPEETFQSLSAELESLLSRLSQINASMSQLASSNASPSASNTAVQHTLQRHRDILQDYRHEFTKTRANIEAVVQRKDLLASVRR